MLFLKLFICVSTFVADKGGGDTSVAIFDLKVQSTMQTKKFSNRNALASGIPLALP